MIKKLPKSKIEFEINVPWATWAKYLDQAAGEISEEIKIAGFRPGKAPRKMVEQKVGKGVVMNNAAEKAVQKSYADFILEEKVEALGSPEVTIEELEEGKDLKYKGAVAVMPDVKISEDYRKAIKKINENYKDKKAEVSENEVKLELEKLANSRVKLVTVRREARNDDSVEIDFDVVVEGQPLENGSSKNHPLILGRGAFIPGFEENIVGMKEGEEKTFALAFPEDYHKKDLSGKKAEFKIKLNLVQERQTPELNDDFAKSLGNFENLEALRKNIAEGMEHEQTHKLHERKKAEYIEKIIEKTETELPDILLDREVEQMLKEFEYQLQSMGLNLDQYLAQIKKEKSELQKEWRPQAEKRVMSALALKELAKMESIQIGAQEIEAEMNKTLQYYKKVKDIEKNIDLEGLYNYTKGVLENDKVFELLESL